MDSVSSIELVEARNVEISTMYFRPAKKSIKLPRHVLELFIACT
jgi:hypothetical protein